MHKSSLVPCWFTGRLISRSTRGLYALTIRFRKRNTSVRTCPLESSRLCVGCISAEPTIASSTYDQSYARRRTTFLNAFLQYKCILFAIPGDTLALTFLVALAATECFIVSIRMPKWLVISIITSPASRLTFHTILSNHFLSVSNSTL